MKCKNVLIVYIFLLLNPVVLFAQDNREHLWRKVLEFSQSPYSSVPFKDTSNINTFAPLQFLQSDVVTSSVFNFIDPAAISSNIRVNNLADDTTTHFTQSEVSLARFGNIIVIGYNDMVGRFASNSTAGYARSTDGGLTFTDLGTLPPPPGGIMLADPSLSVDTNGNFYYAFLALDANGNSLVTVSSSTDAGLIFGQPIIASQTTDPFTLDKEFIAIDTVSGSSFLNDIYISYTRFWQLFPSLPPVPISIEVVRSTNGGQTFDPPVIVGTGLIQGSIPVVGPDGVLYVVWENLNSDNRAVYISISTDGGQNFSTPIFVTNVVDNSDTDATNNCSAQALKGNIRTLQLPSIAVDTSGGPYNGNIYVVWEDGRYGDSDILLVKSPGGQFAGQLWYGPIILNDIKRTTNSYDADQFMPWVTVAPDGKVGVLWYDRRNDVVNNMNIDVYMVVSTDGGNTFGPNVMVTPYSFPPIVGIESGIDPCYMGDYNGMISAPGKFYLAWGDNRTYLPAIGSQQPDVYFASADSNHCSLIDQCPPDKFCNTITGMCETPTTYSDNCNIYGCPINYSCDVATGSCYPANCYTQQGRDFCINILGKCCGNDNLCHDLGDCRCTSCTDPNYPCCSRGGKVADKFVCSARCENVCCDYASDMCILGNCSGCCPCSTAIQIAGLEENKEELIIFGRMVLARNNFPPELIDKFRRVSPEISAIFLSNPEFRIQGRGILQRYLPIIKEVVNGEVSNGTRNRVIPPGDIITINLFLEKFSEGASPDVIDFANTIKSMLEPYEGRTFGELFDDLGLTDIYKKSPGQEKKQ